MCNINVRYYLFRFLSLQLTTIFIIVLIIHHDFYSNDWRIRFQLNQLIARQISQMKKPPQDQKKDENQKKPTTKNQIDSDEFDQFFDHLEQFHKNQQNNQNPPPNSIAEPSPAQTKPHASIETVDIGNARSQNSLVETNNQKITISKSATVTKPSQPANKAQSTIFSSNTFQIMTAPKQKKPPSYIKDLSKESDKQREVKEQADNKQQSQARSKFESSQMKNQPSVSSQKELKKQQEQKEPQQLTKIHLDKDLKSKKYNIKYHEAHVQNRPKEYTFKQKKVKVMSWNVWKETENVNPSNKDARYREIIRVIRENKPHVVCLQEAEEFRVRYLANFLHSDAVGRTYYYSNCSQFSTIILCKMKVEFYEVFFPKEMKTKAMSICQFKIQCSDNKVRSVIVHSVHLKMRSEGTGMTRKYQLDAIQNISKKHDIIIMAGDFNFDDLHADNNMVRYKYLDLQVHNKTPKLEDDQPPHEPNFARNNRTMNEQYVEYTEQMVEQVIEEVIQYQFDEDQSSFDGYSDSCDEDSEGNPYELNSSMHEEGDWYEQDPEDGSFYQEHEHFQDEYEDDHDQYGSQDEQSDNSDSSDDNSFDGDDLDCPRQSNHRNRYHQRSRYYRQPRQRSRQRANSRPPNFTQPRGSVRHKTTTTSRTTYINNRTTNITHYNRPQRQMQRRQSSRSRRNLRPGQIPAQPTDTWTYMNKPSQTYNRFDRILISVKGMDKKVLQRKINSEIFQRLGLQSVGNFYIGQDIKLYMRDGKVRAPSDHLGVFAYFWFNFHFQ